MYKDTNCICRRVIAGGKFGALGRHGVGRVGMGSHFALQIKWSCTSVVVPAECFYSK